MGSVASLVMSWRVFDKRIAPTAGQTDNTTFQPLNCDRGTTPQTAIWLTSPPAKLSQRPIWWIAQCILQPARDHSSFPDH